VNDGISSAVLRNKQLVLTDGNHARQCGLCQHSLLFSYNCFFRRSSPVKFVSRYEIMFGHYRPNLCSNFCSNVRLDTNTTNSRFLMGVLRWLGVIVVRCRTCDSRSWVRIPVTALPVFSETGDRFYLVNYLGM